MTIYSHSRLSCFEQCPHKYKLQYIDRVETEVEESIEAFLGSRVHETLEKLYQDLKFQKENSLDGLLSYLHEIWEKNWDDSIVIVKEEYGPDNYLKMAEKFISDYYNRYQPFNQGKTIALEDRIIINLDKNGNYQLQGYIDRLVEVKDGFYEIHDYKTNSRLPINDYIKNDRQLALYMIGVKNNYPDVKNVKLIWHFLAFDKEIDSTRTNEELENLKKDTIELIQNVESEERFPTNSSRLCDWCEFKTICREWSHLFKLEGKPKNEYLNDDGVQLVNRYAELKNKKKQTELDIYAELEKLEEAIKHFAEKEDVDVVFGSKNKVRIKESEQLKFPSKNSKERLELERLLKVNDLWSDVDQLDTSALNKLLTDKKINYEIADKIKQFITVEKSKKLYLSKK